MGKAQTKKKTRRERHNPMRVPDAHLGGGSAQGKADPAKEREMLPVLNKLKSPEYADRTWACAAICNLIQNDPATRRLFQSKNVVGELIDRLTDDVDEVVVEASGALRNLAIDGGHELCAEMFNKGIMSHLIVLTGKITSTIDSIVSQNAGEQLTDAQLQSRKHLLNLAENVISLIWCLAEANHKTLAAVNGAGVEGLLLRALAGREMLGQGVALAAAHALYSLSQDNWPFTKAVISQPAALNELVAIAKQDHTTIAPKGKGKGKANRSVNEDDGRALLTRVLVAGALRNLVRPGNRADEHVDIVGLTNSTILPLVNSLLDVDLSSVVQQVLDLVTKIPQQNTKLDKGVKTDHQSPAEIALDRIERSLTTVVVGLEILTGICAGLEDSELEAEAAEEADDGDDDQEMDDEDADLPDEALIAMGRDPDAEVNGSSAPQPTVATAVTLSHLLSTLSLPRRLAALSTLNTLSFPPSSSVPSPYPPTTSVLSVLHLRALETLNNLLLTSVASLPADPVQRAQLGGVVPVDGIWNGMFGTVNALLSEPEALKQKGQELRIEVLEMALGCAWGCAKVSAESITLSDVQVKTLMDAPQILRSDMAKTRCIETLAALASRETVSIPENKVIGGWLVGQLSAGHNVEISVALLNAIIDVYADETRSYDTVFVSEGYLDVLASNVGRIRGEVRKIDRRKDLRLRAVAEEVYENLTAFIKYRRALRR